jgi:integrase
MGRSPLPIGTWGKIRVYPSHYDAKGKPDTFRAMTRYRDFDGRTRTVTAYGKSKTAAENNLRTKLKERTATGRSGELTALHRFSDAADLWMEKFRAMVADGKRSPSSLETYERQLRNHVLPALGEVRLGEATTPLVDRVIGAIRRDVSPATAKTCRSAISGAMSLAVRYGAIPANPVREVERIESKPKKQPRALTLEERSRWLAQLAGDPKARRKDLPDLTAFLLATGCRIGEALAVVWSQVDLEAGVVEITHTIVRIKGEGLLRKSTKTSTGERVLQLPRWATSMLRTRFMTGARLDQPLFPDVLGGFRDPANVRRDIRDVRGSGELAWITSHNFRKTTATILDEAGLSARAVADQLGHARPSMTQDVYMGRRVLNGRAAHALESAISEQEDDEKCS